ncbi:MAG: 16S rRNA (uracil(1498)-N(3))-methyltransferase [Nitrospinaceae bacterium]|nr:16S rRNA (uracil(1498)-N(3))-methyltransferase [Nitrospinaceae bacterium]NIR57373.1 16S rRNA (uracil(1498)-N(3))-methyltransferase [Nitrospinaceae bacterium]NIS87825.1 16S rRNA (uracil(1498)-N(3))-methyltransferase [Nitrospinaceae bacterium]NIT84695.1 16S rRNA (uracil(1498)-N(3))-methyltransferase [Nitrospinaceae bacterium]NIU46874.1 16S rRNA (uracil(1498)-N(3))-methyltransferase [Nitrospinaceae bacterium]
MHRFFVPPEDFSNGTVTIRGPDVNHIRTVLRMKPGDRIGVLDGRGQRFEVELTGLTKDEVTGEIVSQSAVQTESPIEIAMGQALIKGNGFDNLVRKSVELGVHSIWPLKSHRCVAEVSPGSHKLERWQRIAEEAAKQCGRTHIPAVHSPVRSVEEYCREVADCDLKLVFWEGESTVRLHEIENEKPVSSIAFAAGPEGGWTAAEIDGFRQQGFRTVSLGPRILKADAASLVILSLLQHRWGDL